MSVRAQELRLEVDDASAVWPVTIDPTIAQQAYLKASNAAGGDCFGHSVAISGDTVVVGANQESSNATGVNGDQTDNSAAAAGAAYIFTGITIPPTITPAAALARTQSSAASNATIATVSDTNAGTLTVTATTVPAGISVTGIVNSGGTVTANVAAGCTASLGANLVGLTVTNATTGQSGTANLTVNVAANTAPSLVYGNTSVNAGSSTTNSPTTATDNGSITGYSVLSPGTYTGTISVNPSGVVSISAAAPVGAHTITIRATDNCGATTDATFTLTVNCQTITVNPATINSTTTGAAFNQVFTQTGGNGAITWSLIGTTPPGLSFTAATATLAGSPTTSGSFSFTIRATDANGCFGERQYTLGVDCASVTVSPMNPALTGGTAGTPYSQSFTAPGGALPYMFTTSAGTLPPSLTLNSNGLLSGTPTGFGNFNFTIRATDTNGCFGERAYSLRICPIITLTASLPGGTTGVAYSQTITASGGASPYGFAVTGGNLPPGLSLNSNGALTGSPMQSGAFNFTVTATDAR